LTFAFLTDIQGPTPFGGSGATLNGRSVGQPSTSSIKGKGKEKEKESQEGSSASWGVGGGHTLGNAIPRDLGPVGAGGARIPRMPARSSSTQVPKKRSPSPESEHDWGVDTDDEDVIMIDSD